MTPIQRLVFWLGRFRWWSWLTSHLLPRIDRGLHRLSRGRLTLTQLVIPVLVLETTGRRSGLTRQTPLTYLEVDGGFAVAASSFGRGGHPAWSHNLLADPDAKVVLDGREIAVRARLVDDDEHRRLMPEFVALYPPYRIYRERVADRGIRIFHLEPWSPDDRTPAS